MYRLAAVLLGCLAACGDDGGLTALDAGPDTPPPTGLFDSPDDFDRAGCVPGSLGSLDPQGIYHLQILFEGQRSTTAARFDVLGGGAFGGVLNGRDATSGLATADDLFLRRADETTVRALDLCARDPDGLLSGQYVFCNDQGCVFGQVTAAKVERLPEPEGGGLALLGEHGGAGTWGPGLTVNVRVLDGRAYLARYQDGLRILDVSDPANISELGHGPVESADGNEIYNDVKLAVRGDRTFAFMGSNRAGAVVWEVTDPSAPRIVAHLGTAPGNNRPPNVHTLFLDGTLAFLANTGLGLEIWDVLNPETPARLSILPPPPGDDAFLHDLYVADGRAYLNSWGGGMVIANVTDPLQPRRLGVFADYGETSSHSSWVTTVGARRIAAHGDEQWGSHLRLVDVTEPGAAQQVGEWQTRPEVSIHNVMAFGTTVYAAHYQDGVRLIDIADPAAPRQVAWWNTWPGHDPRYGYSFFEGAVGLDVDLAARRIYVADSHRGLLVLQDTRP